MEWTVFDRSSFVWTTAVAFCYFESCRPTRLLRMDLNTVFPEQRIAGLRPVNPERRNPFGRHSSSNSDRLKTALGGLKTAFGRHSPSNALQSYGLHTPSDAFPAFGRYFPNNPLQSYGLQPPSDALPAFGRHPPATHHSPTACTPRATHSRPSAGI